MTGRKATASILSSEGVTGLIFLTVALAFAFVALRELEIGVPRRMGPGFVPLLSAAGLGTVGLVLLVKAWLGSAALPRFAPARALVLIPFAMLGFAFTLKALGMIAACMICMLFSSAATPANKWISSLVAAALVTLFCVLVFKYAIGINVTLFGSWLGRG